MANLPWTPEQAEALLASGRITPEQHQTWQQQNPSFASTAPVDPFGLSPAGGGFPSLASLGGGALPSGPTLGPNASQLPAPTTAPSPLNVTVEGGVTLAPKPKPKPTLPADPTLAAARKELASQRSPQGAPSGKAIPAAVGDRGSVEEGLGLPSAPTSLEQAEGALGRRLSDRERKDPELQRRLTSRTQERSGVEGADRMREQAVTDKTETAIKEADEAYRTHSYVNAMLQSNAMRDDEARRKDHEDVKQRIAALDAEADAVSKRRADAGNIHVSKNLGNSILSGFMSFLGAAGAHLRQGNSNAYAQKVNADIERELEIQKARLSNAKDNLAMKRSLLGDLVKVYGDEDAARVAAQARLKEWGAGIMESTAMKYGDEKAKADGLAVAANLRKEAESDKLNASTMVGNQLTAERAAARAAEAARQKEDRDRRWELTKGQVAAARDAVAQAQKDGVEAPKWATDALSMDQASTRPAEGNTVLDRAHRQTVEVKRQEEGLETEARLKALQSGSTAVDGVIDGLKKNGTKGNISGAIVPGLNQVPGTDAYANRVTNDDWNNRMTLQLGPVVEAMNKGKPGAVELKTLQQELHWSPTMTNDEKIRRAERLQQLQKDAAAIYQAELRTSQPAKQGGSKENPYARYKVAK